MVLKQLPHVVQGSRFTAAGIGGQFPQSPHVGGSSELSHITACVLQTAGAQPGNQVGQFVAIEPQSMFPAYIQHHIAGAAAEVSSDHQAAAMGTLAISLLPMVGRLSMGHRHRFRISSLCVKQVVKRLQADP